MNTKDLVLLGALGFGAYYLMTRRTGAAPAVLYRPTTLGGSNTAANVNAFTNLLGTVGNYFKGGSGGGTVLGGVTLGSEGLNPYFSNDDMFAINPANSYSLGENYLGTGSYL